MIRFLLDTDILSLSERGEPSIRRRIRALGPDEFAISAVSAEEMLRGRLALLARRSEGERRVHAYRKLVATIRLIQRTQLVDFDMVCERKLNELCRHKIRIGSRDLRIAATALVHDFTMVTRNTTDFRRVPGLRIEDWSVG